MLTLILATTVIAILLAKFYYKTKKYPPGPIPLPLMGNMIQMFRDGIKDGGIRPLLHKWKKEFGPIYTVWMGPVPVVFFCDYELSQESMVKKGQHFVDRQYFYIQEINRRIFVSNGHHWLEQRRFALQTLRDFGLGRNLMEERIMLEFDYRSGLLDKELKEKGKLTWNPRKFCELTVGNIINRMLFSERFSENKEAEFFRLKEQLDYIVESATVLDGLMSETNKSWPFFNKRYKSMKGVEDTIMNFIRGQIEDKKRAIASGHGGECEDFVETYLTKMKTGEYSEEFNEGALVISLFDLWVAGQESTATTLQWGLAYLIRNPKCLEKLQMELDEVTGRNRHVSLKDRPNTPYLNAIVQETLRVSSLVPLNVLARICAEDIRVNGYMIPKGTATAVQIGVVMSDEKTFKDPYEFNPDRYTEGEPEQNVLAFGLGKRACPGESLARAELFMLIGNMVLEYKMEAIPGREPLMTAEKENMVLRRATPYEMYISKRL